LVVSYIPGAVQMVNTMAFVDSFTEAPRNERIAAAAR
jgi:hypothetical protein